MEKEKSQSLKTNVFEDTKNIMRDGLTMKMISVRLLSLCLIFMFCACGSSPTQNNGASPEEAQAAARSALDRMDGKQPASGSSAGQSAAPNASSAQQGAVVNTGKGKPAWVDSVDSVYSRSQYVAAVGYAADRAMAEKNALASLVAIFGQSIRADQTIVNTYQEAVKNGITAGWTDNIAMNNTIQTSASMDTLVGAETKEVWYDSKSTYFAVAVLDKPKAIQTYSNMIKSNQAMIDNLLNMTAAEKNSLDGFARYQFAATIADINIGYGNLLSVIGEPSYAQALKRGDDYRLEAKNIANAIPVGITVKNDKAGRIQGAFAKALTEAGFRSGGTNSRYRLEADFSLSPVELPQNKWARYELTANLVDTASGGSVLVPYSINGREGHATQAEADNRTYATAERKIGEEYKGLLSNYLSQLLPKR
jgi:hypothetical protein